MKRATTSGMNRTGLDTSPEHAKELVEGAEQALPSSEGDALRWPCTGKRIS